MNRRLVAFALLALTVLAAACATTPATPTLKGVITQIEDNTITIKPAAGDPAKFDVDRATRVYWFNGTNAGRSTLTVGHPVQVWLGDGTQKATKVVIGS